MTRALACLAALALSGCTAIVTDDLGDLQVNSSSQQDIDIRLVGFDPHVGQLVDISIIDPSEEDDGPDFIQARAVLDTLPSSCVEIRMRRAAPVSASRVDFYADLNMSGTQDPTPDDHAWRCDDTLETPCALDMGSLTFPHNFMFQDIVNDAAQPIGGDVVINLTGADEHDGRTVTAQLLTEVVVNAETGETETTVPGLYFRSSISGGEATMRLPGMTDGGRTYDLELTFGDDASICTLPGQRAPTTGDFVIDAPLSSLECVTPEAVDCAALQMECPGNPEACRTLFRRCAIVDCAR